MMCPEITRRCVANRTGDVNYGDAKPLPSAADHPTHPRLCRGRVHHSHIIVDDEDGVGGGVVDQLPGVKGFVAASSPIPTRSALRRQLLPSASLEKEGVSRALPFQHLKAQCAFKLAELVERHRIAAKPAGDEDEIMEDFAQIRQKDMDKDGKLKIVPKEEVREALGRSSDVGYTFLMRMYFELLKDAAGNPNTPYAPSVTAMNRRHAIDVSRKGDSESVFFICSRSTGRVLFSYCSYSRLSHLFYSLLFFLDSDTRRVLYYVVPQPQPRGGARDLGAFLEGGGGGRSAGNDR
jgi:hypothetical protein